MRPDKHHHRENENDECSAVQTSSTVDVDHLKETTRTHMISVIFIAQPINKTASSGAKNEKVTKTLRGLHS
jgi:hypothetical protein